MKQKSIISDSLLIGIAEQNGTVQLANQATLDTDSLRSR